MYVIFDILLEKVLYLINDDIFMNLIFYIINIINKRIAIHALLFLY